MGNTNIHIFMFNVGNLNVLAKEDKKERTEEGERKKRGEKGWMRRREKKSGELMILSHQECYLSIKKKN